MPKVAAIVTALIVERPLCADCIADKAGLSRERVAATLRQLQDSLTVHRARRRCHGCGDVCLTLSLDRPDG